MRELWSELYRRNSVLAVTGALHALLLVGAIIGTQVDARIVMGVNVWIKPMKFMASIALYTWTVAWLVGHLTRPRWAIRVVAWGIALAMVVESVCLWIQAIRGTTSHYNTATAFDASVFSAMGMMIALDSVLMVGLLLLFFGREVSLPAPYKWGIRLGIVVFLVGSSVGGSMISNGAHTVGVPDGGPGLPLLNWSTVAGDLRIAHALGLHGLQVFPILGFLLGRWSALTSTSRRLAVLAVFTAVYVGALGAAYLQAQAGSPLLTL